MSGARVPAAVTWAAAAALVFAPAAPAAASVAAPGWTYSVSTVRGHVPRCASEDSDGCVWNAAVRGNRRGVSFLALPHGQLVRLHVWHGHLVPSRGWAVTDAAYRSPRSHRVTEVDARLHVAGHRYWVSAERG